MKTKYFILYAVLGILIYWWYSTRKSRYLTNWAKTESDPSKQNILLLGVKELEKTDLDILYDIVKNYFNKSIPLPQDLKSAWLRIAGKYFPNL